MLLSVINCETGLRLWGRVEFGKRDGESQ